MIFRLIVLILLNVSFFNVTLAEPSPYVRIKNGVIVFKNPVFTGTVHAVKLEVISDDIIRVVVSPGTEITNTQSLVVVTGTQPDSTWEIVSDEEKLTLKTKKIVAEVNLKTGAVTFFDLKGNKIIGEKSLMGRSFKPAIFEGERYYSVTQTFQTEEK